MIVQVYAFTRVEEAVAAARMGVDHVGFVAGAYGLVHAELSFGQARAMVEALPEGVVASALTMANEVDEILRMARQVGPSIIHISSDPEEVGPDAMLTLRRGLPDWVRLMKAISVSGPETVEVARRYAACSDLLLLDTKVGGLPGVGATGRVHDWAVSRRIVEAVETPVILAGGLTPENVGAAIRAVRPSGVDSNTGTNLAGDPTVKDLARVRAFVRAARRHAS